CPFHRGLQSNHRVPRAQGGPTDLANSDALCPRCHALFEVGLIELKKEPGEALRVIRRGDCIREEIEKEARKTLEIPPRTGAESRRLDFDWVPAKYRDAVRALEWTRCPTREAEEHVRRAYEHLKTAGQAEPSVQAVIDAAWKEISKRRDG